MLNVKSHGTQNLINRIMVKIIFQGDLDFYHIPTITFLKKFMDFIGKLELINKLKKKNSKEIM